MYLTIFQAIEQCRLLHFYYRGYFRILEPHIYGTGRSGKDVLCGYQIAGADAAGKHVGWKSFDVKEIENIQVLSAHFVGPRPGFHHPTSRSWTRIYVQLKSTCLPIAASSHNPEHVP